MFSYRKVICNRGTLNGRILRFGGRTGVLSSSYQAALQVAALHIGALHINALQIAVLLAQIENHGADAFSGDPELMMHDWPGTTAVMPDG
jgi:hypothetical protein